MSFANIVLQNNINSHTFEEDKKIIKDTLGELLSRYQLKSFEKSKEELLQKSLQRFSSLNAYDSVFLVDSVEILKGKSSSILSVVSINSVFSGEKHQQDYSITELEFIGIVYLQKDYGEVYIRPETVADKINRWIKKVDIVFEIDRQFSKRYYVLASDKDKLKRNMSKNFLAAIKKHKNIEIEIIDSVLMVRTRKPVSIEVAMQIAELITDINNNIN